MISGLIDRLKTVGALKLVGGAPAYAAAAEARPTALPAAYVLPLQEQPGANELACAVAQMVTASFGIALAITNVADAKGGGALLDIDALRKSVRQGLLGWTPDGAQFPMEFGGGALLGFKNGVLWWQDIYVTQYLIKN